LLITSTPGKQRSTRAVRQQKQLRVSTAGHGQGSKGSKQPAQEERSAEWVECEVEEERVPAYRPDHQLHLLPPTATVRRVSGFAAAAGFNWLASGQGQLGQQLLYAAGNVLLAEGLAGEQGTQQSQQQSQHQRHLARLPRDITAVAATADGRLAAAAVRPSAAEGGTSEIHLVALGGQAPAELPVLSHHSYAVQVGAGWAQQLVAARTFSMPTEACNCLASDTPRCIPWLPLGQSICAADNLGTHHLACALLLQVLAFSPDGSLLASLSHAPDGSGSSLALWSTEDPADAEMVAAVQLPGVVADLAWAAQDAPEAAPTFYTAGAQGLVQWQLEPEALTSTAVHMPAVLRGVPLTAVACAAEGPAGHEQEDSRQHGAAHTSKTSSSTVYVGDGSGRVWQLEVDEGQDVRRSQVLAEVQGQAVTCLCAAGASLLAVGTGSGGLLLLAEEAWSGREATWRMLSGEQLDGAIVGLQLDADRRSVTAATACGTLWQLAPGSSSGSSSNSGSAFSAQVLLCGQQHSLRGWHLAPGAAWKGAQPAVAMASDAGVAVWQLVSACRRLKYPMAWHFIASSKEHMQEGNRCAAKHDPCLHCSVSPVPTGRGRHRRARPAG